MPLGTQLTGGIASAGRLTGAISPATRLSGGIRRQDENYNLVLIVYDDGGAENFNWSGLTMPSGGHFVTPRLDEMRTKGVTFTRAYACPICGPSRARLLSSQYGFDSGLAGNIEASDVYAFGGGGQSIAQATAGDPIPPITLKLMPKLLRLGRNGTDDIAATLGGLSGFSYQQAAFGKTHLCSDTGRETYFIDHGFGRYVGQQPNAGTLPADGSANIGHFHFTEITHSYGSPPSTKDWGAAGAWPAGGPYSAYDTTPNPDAAWDAYKVYRDAIQWINSRTQPFFALLTFNPPHAPIEVPPYTAPDDVGQSPPGGTFNLLSTTTQTAMTALDGGGKGPGYKPSAAASKRAVYRANAEAIDSLIGKLWDRMEPTRRDKTIFVLIGDNGTVADGVDTPYTTGHAKRTIYEMGSRVPCIVWGPPSVISSPGRFSDHLVHIVDVMPTAFELLGCEAALWNPGNARKVRGKSFARVIRERGVPAARDHIYGEMFLPLAATIAGPTAIDPTQWVKSYSDGIYKVIVKSQGAAPPPYEFYRIDSTLQPGSGLAGYFEDSQDNLYSLVGTAGQELLTARFQALLAAMNSLLSS